LIINPDLASWTKYKTGVVLALHPFINDFLIRYTTGMGMEQTNKLRSEVGFAPLNIPKVSGYTEQTVVGLNNAFAGYCLYTYLGILLYMVI